MLAVDLHQVHSGKLVLHVRTKWGIEMNHQDISALLRRFSAKGSRRAAMAAVIGGSVLGAKSSVSAKKKHKPKPTRNIEVSGERVVLASREQVFAALTDPAALAQCIPGIGQHSVVGTDEYESPIQIGFGKIGGTYQGNFKIEDKVAPSSYRILVSAAGPGGTTSGAADVDLVEQLGNALLSWDGSAQLSGRLAKVGGGVTRPAASALVNQFLTCFADNL